MARPIPCPIMVASRIPASATRVSPYFACIPSRPWFTSPIFPLSSPNTIVWGYISNSLSKLSLMTIRASTSCASSYCAGVEESSSLVGFSLYKCELYRRS